MNMIIMRYYPQEILYAKTHLSSYSTNLVLPKRFETFLKISAISALSFCGPVMAQEQNGWQFDSLRADSSVSKPDAQQVYEVLLKMLDRWNAHDIEGHLAVYWKSPELLVVIDSEQFNCWQQLHDSYLNGYPDRHAMGFIQPKLFNDLQRTRTVFTRSGPRCWSADSGFAITSQSMG
jgi:hypothetical protein